MMCTDGHLIPHTSSGGITFQQSKRTTTDESSSVLIIRRKRSIRSNDDVDTDEDRQGEIRRNRIMTIKSPLRWPFFTRITSSFLSSSPSPSDAKGKLFGGNLCVTDGQLPVPVVNMMRQLYLKGPSTLGIFRKSANARLCREIASRLEEDPEFLLDDVPITVIGSVFKDFLRSLPNCLLDSRLLNRWIRAVTLPSDRDQRESIEKLLKKLPHEHLLLLKHVICLLWHISQHSSVNKMCTNNLALCIGPSLLSSNKIISISRREEVSKNVPKVICYLIDHCTDLFGENVLTLLGPEPLHTDSRAGVSSDPSFHSIHVHSSSTSPSSVRTTSNGSTTGQEAAVHNEERSQSLSNLPVHEKQMMRMRERSEWFLKHGK